MSTDEDRDAAIERRLAAAGTQWQAANARPADVDLVAAPARRQHRLAMAVSAAAVVALAITLGFWLGRSGTGSAQVAGPVVGTLTQDAPPPSAGDAQLAGHIWQLWSIEKDTSTQHSSIGTDDLARDTVTFTNGALAIGHRCYEDKADVDVEGSTMDVTHVRLQSAVPCPATQTQAREQQHAGRMDAVLSGTSHWSISSGQLRITKGVTTLVFIPTGGGPTSTEIPRRLLTKTWQLISLSSQSANSGSPDLGITLKWDGSSFVLAHRCYLIKLSAIVGKGTIDIVSAHRTDHSCPAGGNAPQIDTTVDAALSGTVTWKLDRAGLHVTKGTTTLVFRAV